MSLRHLFLILLLPLVLLAKASEVPANVSMDYRDVVQARFSGTYAILINADGGKRLVPVSSLRSADLDWIKQIAETNPATRGKSTVKVVAAPANVIPAKKTIVTSKVEQGVETVLLCPPRVPRDQIGGTCMLYARVHWLDIAGYYVDAPTIYKIINGAPPDSPWDSQRYVTGLITIITNRKPRPLVHRPPLAVDPFDWARAELRKGRPILAALPREIWQALPPGFIASRPWSGGSVGHQIVVNGFTFNRDTGEGTFHIVNTWSELQEFDIKLDAARGGNLVFEASLSPVGEVSVAGTTTKETVKSITLIKSTGATSLYEVVTNQGTRRILAPDEAAARRLIEEDQ